MFRKRSVGFLIAVGLSIVFSNNALANLKKSLELAKIIERGTIEIGVKKDFAPFGFLGKEGNLRGFEVDLAQAVGKELGVKVVLVPVSTANRFQRLEQGLVQMVIATAADTRERRRIATAIEPGYFGAGVNVLLSPTSRVKDWPDLTGKNICALQSAYFNKGITSRYLIDLKTYKTISNAHAALLQGDCVGFLYSEIAIQRYLKMPKFAGYKAELQSKLIVPWAAYIARSEKGSDFEQKVGNAIAKFHREGVLLKLQKKWALPTSTYLNQNQKRWAARGQDNQLVCTRLGSGDWVPECRDPAFITSADVEGVAAVLKKIEEYTGLNFSFAYDQYDRTRYISGILYSVIIIVSSSILSLFIGFWFAKILTSENTFARVTGQFVTFVAGHVPPLLSMYFIFFGIGAVIANMYGLKLSAILVAILCLAVYHAAIIANTLTNSYKLFSSELTKSKLSVKDLPEILKTAATGINGAITNLVKASMIASAIAVPELLAATIGIFSDQGNPNEMMILLFLIFLVFTITWLSIVRKGQEIIMRISS